MSFQRQGLSFPFSLDYLKKYDEAVQENNARELLFAVDKEGRIHSVFIY